MSAVRPDIVKWITSRAADITEDGGITCFIVYHEGVDSHERLHRHNCPTEDDNEPGALEDIAQLLWDAAETDAKNRFGAKEERYVLIAYRDIDGRLEDDCQTSFTLPCGGYERSFAGNTEPPTEKGVIAQQMRINAEQHRLIVEMSTSALQRQERENERLSARLEKQDAMQLKLMEMHQALADRAQERELERAEALQKSKRMDQIADLGIAMAPLILAKVLGSSGGMAKSLPARGARDEAVGKIIKSLSADEVTAIVENLSSEHQIMFFEIYKSYSEDLKKAEQEKPEILQDTDVVGERTVVTDEATQH